MKESVMFNDNCMDGMRGLPDDCFDIALCDIPYGIGVGKMAFLKETATKVKQKNGNRISAMRNKKDSPYTPKEWDNVVPGQEYFDELVRVSKNQIIFGIEYTDWVGVGPGRIKWDKGFSEGVSFNKYETAYCSSISGTVVLPLLWAGMMQAKSLSSPMSQQGNKKLNEKRIHPCHKPVLLYRKLIRDYGFPGMSILDTHVGGGSSRIAAMLEGCSFMGWEIDKEYFDLQEKRFKVELQKRESELF